MRRFTSLFVLLLVPVLAYASDSLNVYQSALLYNNWESCYGADVDGDYLYHSGAAAGLNVVDMSNSNGFTIVGSVPGSVDARMVEVCNGLAVIARFSEEDNDPGGFYLVDVANPCEPHFLGLFEEEYVLYAFKWDGDYLYTLSEVDGDAQYLKTYVITGNEPEEISSQLVTSSSAYAGLNKFLRTEDYLILWVISDIYIYSLEDTANPSILTTNSFSTDFFIKDVLIYNDMLMVSGKLRSNDYFCLQAYDISSPESPVLIDEFTRNPAYHYMEFYNNSMMVSDGETLFVQTSCSRYGEHETETSYYLYDFVCTDTLNCLDETGLSNPGNVLGYYDNSILFIASNVMQIDLDTREFVIQYLCDNFPSNMTVVNDSTIYIEGSSRVRYLVNISDPSHPIEIGHAPLQTDFLPYSYYGIYGFEYPYAAKATYDGISLYDFTDPLQEILVSNYDDVERWDVQQVQLHYPYITYIYCDYTFCILDVSVPSSPVLIGVANLPYGQWDYETYCIHNDKVYLGRNHFYESLDPNNGIIVLDISTPELPYVSGFVPIDSIHTNQMYMMLVHNSTLFFSFAYTGGTDYIGSFSLVNPDYPQLLDTLGYRMQSCRWIDADGDYLYLGDRHIIEALNIEDPTAMVSEGWYQADREVNGVHAYNGGIWTSGEYSIRCYQLGEPSDAENQSNPEELPSLFVLRHPYPNPFNACTRVSYFLPSQSQVNVEVYNLQGRLVATLLNGTNSAGSHQVMWDGRSSGGVSVASGPYFIRVNVGDSYNTQRVILLR